MKTLDKLKMAAREQYTFPGGYELIAITFDGELLCSDCVRVNYKECLHDTKHKWHTSFEIVDVVSESELEDVFCDHCYKAIGYQND